MALPSIVYICFHEARWRRGDANPTRLSGTSAIAQGCTATLSRSLIALTSRATTFSDVGLPARQGWPRSGLGLPNLLELFLL
jgi:hypothetical protein